MKERWSIPVVLLVLLVAAAVSRADSVRFAVLGDSRGDSADQSVNDTVFSQIVQGVLAADPPVRFVVLTGDLVRGSQYSGAMASAFQAWRQLAGPWYAADYLGAKVYAAPGNHDEANILTYRTLWQQAFSELPDNGPEADKKLVYSFEAGPCHICVVNTSSPIPRLAHVVDLDWLAADLASSTKPINLVVGHEPAYPQSSHIGSSLDAKPDTRDAFWQLLTERDVKAYFCGHEHTYGRGIKDNVTQIITGGAGAPGSPFHYLIVDADNQDVSVSVYYVDNNTLHEQYKLSETQNVPVLTDLAGGTGQPQIKLSNLLSCPFALAVILMMVLSFGGLIVKLENGNC